MLPNSEAAQVRLIEHVSTTSHGTDIKRPKLDKIVTHVTAVVWFWLWLRIRINCVSLDAKPDIELGAIADDEGRLQARQSRLPAVPATTGFGCTKDMEVGVHHNPHKKKELTVLPPGAP